MDRIGIRELRQNASRYIRRVKDGESIEVTERGVPVAVLSPAPESTRSRYEQLVAEGRIHPGQGDLLEWLAENPPVPMGSDRHEPTATEILLRMREDERD